MGDFVGQRLDKFVGKFVGDFVGNSWAITGCLLGGGLEAEN